MFVYTAVALMGWLISLRKQVTFPGDHYWFPHAMTSDEQLEKFHNKDNMSLCYPDLGSTSDWLKQISIVAQLIRSARSGQWSLINAEFLYSFVRCYLVGGGGVGWGDQWNVSRFLLLFLFCLFSRANFVWTKMASVGWLTC